VNKFEGTVPVAVAVNGVNWIVCGEVLTVNYKLTLVYVALRVTVQVGIAHQSLI
jgi:hypothetical protein